MTWQIRHSDSSVARPCGNCPQCGGQLYENLTHHCSNAVRFAGLSYKDQPSNLPVVPAAQGWVCPKCGRVYSPQTLDCRACNLVIEVRL